VDLGSRAANGHWESAAFHPAYCCEDECPMWRQTQHKEVSHVAVPFSLHLRCDTSGAPAPSMYRCWLCMRRFVSRLLGAGTRQSLFCYLHWRHDRNHCAHT
jgi:hypothetical protein